MEDNLKLYNEFRQCPQDAQRPIKGGKLKGKTDINPMWRIKALTEAFGPCGMGWKTTNETFWTTPGANGEVVAWCSMNLYYFDTEVGEWSDPVFGVGGSMLVDTQNSKLASNDDAYKMAYTDAISVACKALGMAADIYWAEDSTKYGRNETRDQAPPAIPAHVCERCKKPVIAMRHGGQLYSIEQVVEMSKSSFGQELCWSCAKDLKSEQAGEGHESGF